MLQLLQPFRRFTNSSVSVAMAEIDAIRPLNPKSSPIDILLPKKSTVHSTDVPAPASYPKFDSGDRLLRNTYSESSIMSLLSRRSAPEHRYFVAQFLLPSTSEMRARLLDSDQRVCLRSFSANRWRLSGTILVRGSGSEKRVFVRHTLDDWLSSTDTEATFLEKDSASDADRYHFRLDFPFRLPSETRLHLAVAYCLNGHTHWDNRGGLNYVFTYNSRSNSRNSIDEGV